MNQGDISPQKMAKLNSRFIIGMQTVCLKKCVPDFKAADLTSGEKNCVDRCISKYYATNDVLGRLFAQDRTKA